MKSCQECKIVFFGTSEFGAIVLEKLVQAVMTPVLVVTTPDKPVGRKQELTPSPVKVAAQKFGISVIQPEKLDQDTRYKIQDTNPDLFVVASYGKILPKEILDIPKYGALNIHPSLLPKYRGASPIQTALLDGGNETGVTIILMDEKMDHGPILAQQEFPISPSTPSSGPRGNFQFSKPTYLELHNKLAELGAELLIKIIPDWIAGNIKPVPQDHSQATFTRHIKKEDGRIDWNKEAVYIERQVRALYPWPGTYTKFEIRSTKSETIPKILKILNASVLFQKEKSTKHVGETFLNPEGNIAVQTGQDILVIDKLQLEGGKPMSSKEFLLGHREAVGLILH